MERKIPKKQPGADSNRFPTTSRRKRLNSLPLAHLQKTLGSTQPHPQTLKRRPKPFWLRHLPGFRTEAAWEPPFCHSSGVPRCRLRRVELFDGRLPRLHARLETSPGVLAGWSKAIGRVRARELDARRRELQSLILDLLKLFAEPGKSLPFPTARKHLDASPESRYRLFGLSGTRFSSATAKDIRLSMCLVWSVWVIPSETG